MSIHVPSLLVDKKTFKPMSPVDIVMGTPWGEVEPGNSLRLSLLYHVFKQHQPSTQRSGRLTTRRLPNLGPESFVKLIRNGGTTNAKGMRAQMNYLTQNGDVKLELSDLYFGAKLEDAEREELIESWNISSINKGDYDKTHHVVVSFPQGTNCNEPELSAARTGIIGHFSTELFGTMRVPKTTLSENETTLFGTRPEISDFDHIL